MRLKLFLLTILALISPEVRAGTGEFWNGDRSSFQTRLLFQPSYQFAADVSWNHSNITLPSGDFDTDLLTTRLRYSFNTGCS